MGGRLTNIVFPYYEHWWRIMLVTESFIGRKIKLNMMVAMATQRRAAMIKKEHQEGNPCQWMLDSIPARPRCFSYVSFDGVSATALVDATHLHIYCPLEADINDAGWGPGRDQLTMTSLQPLDSRHQIKWNAKQRITRTYLLTVLPCRNNCATQFNSQLASFTKLERMNVK